MLIAALLALVMLVLTVDCVVWVMRVLLPAVQRGQRPVTGPIATWRAYFRERW
jgi:hypothetical protein